MKICLDCGICCFNTEMQLSENDIKVIEKNQELNREEFTIFREGFKQLKNKDENQAEIRIWGKLVKRESSLLHVVEIYSVCSKIRCKSKKHFQEPDLNPIKIE